MVTVAVLMPTSADLLTVRLLRDGSAVALRFASSSVHGQMRGSCVLGIGLSLHGHGHCVMGASC